MREFIEEHPTEEVSLDDLARAAGLSRSSFCRLFKRSTGTTPYKYMMQQRLTHAKTVLAKEDRSIAEIAYHFNFSDQSHFSRLFKSTFGMTPGEVQKHQKSIASLSTPPRSL